MLNVVADLRWAGDHGIGRFTRQVMKLIPHVALRTGGRPMDAIDPLRLALAMHSQPPGRLFFSPGYNAPIQSRVPYVFTVHDLNHIDRPENSGLAKRIYYAAILRPACRRAARVFTVSEYSRRRIIDWAGVPTSQVVNVGNGVGEEFSAHGTTRALGHPYFLCVSNRRPHKNESRVVSAVAAARLPPEVGLIFTGDPTPELEGHIRASGLSKRVSFSGTVSDEALAGLYRGALGLVFPSLYEGFGLPVVEAMACGTPVITSTTTALPEIAGDAAILVDPLSINEIAEALSRLHDDMELRLRLRVAGLRRAPQFNWASVAQRAMTAMADIHE